MLVVGVYILKFVTPTRSEPELPPTVLTRSHVVVSCPLRSRPQHTQSSDNHSGGQLRGGQEPGQTHRLINVLLS